VTKKLPASLGAMIPGLGPRTRNILGKCSWPLRSRAGALRSQTHPQIPWI